MEQCVCTSPCRRDRLVLDSSESRARHLIIYQKRVYQWQSLLWMQRDVEQYLLLFIEDLELTNSAHSKRGWHASSKYVVNPQESLQGLRSNL